MTLIWLIMGSIHNSETLLCLGENQISLNLVVTFLDWASSFHPCHPLLHFPPPRPSVHCPLKCISVYNLVLSDL